MILVTGASGFIGSALVKHLADKEKYTLKVVARSEIGYLSNNITQVCIASIDKRTLWFDALRNVDVIIHVAARVHIMNDKSENSLEGFRKTNVEGTLRLAKQARDAGVKRFIYISSIKVNGDTTEINKPFQADDKPNPKGGYAVSKHEAEQGLIKISNKSGLKVVIIRPPLVYGAGVKANFHYLLKWLDKGIPLPFGLIKNKRSMVSLDNLIDLITTCIRHPSAINQIFLVSDGQDLSTTELIRQMSKALDKPIYFLPIPQTWFINLMFLINKKDIGKRLCDSLQVDITKTRQLLDWEPTSSIKEACQKAAQAYLNEKSR